MHSKIMENKTDSVYSGDDTKATTNVNSLRKLFESNFKLSNITKPFKWKSNTNSHKNVNIPKSVVFDEDVSCRHFTKFSDGKENQNECKWSRAASPAGSYLSCKIENCCCKTFFRQYNETPIFRLHPLPKLPLQERNGNLTTFDRQRPERWSASSSSYNIKQQQQQLCRLHHVQHPDTFIHTTENRKCDSSRNKFYSISYEFYKSKSREIFDETPISAVSTKRLERLVSTSGRRVNLLKKITNSENADNCEGNADSSSSSCSESSDATSFHETNASGFFTVASLNEGGYMKSLKDRQFVSNVGQPDLIGCVEDVESGARRKEKNRHQNISKQRSLDEKILNGDQEVEVHHIGAFGFKCRLPKLKNMGLREKSHPYSVKKPRLTVKGVKNRNMRNVKRRQKLTEGLSLARSQTFSGYDNLAYRRSMTDHQLSEQRAKADEQVDELVSAAASDKAKILPGDVIWNKNIGATGHKPRPASVSAIGVNDGPQFHSDSRMTCYDWRVSSFYIEPSEKVSSKPPRRSTSTFDLSTKLSSHEKNVNPLVGKTNLKRHCSLGYLEEEFSEYNCTSHRRSLENVNKTSTASNIQKGSEMPKIISARNFENFDIHVHALFAAVEHGYIEKTKSILESSNVNVNCVNSDGLSPLDVALLSNNKMLVKLLVTYGAQEGRKFYSTDMRNHLCRLLHEAESRVQELSQSLQLNPQTDQSSMSLSSNGISSVNVVDNSKKKNVSLWERRAKGLKRMLTGFEQIKPPDPPSIVTIEVTSTSSIVVYFTESDNENSSMTTKFKVQVSTDEDFLSLCGHYEVADIRQPMYHIKNLSKGQSYYVRVASGNIKGYSAYKLSTPLFIIPSSWQDVTRKDFRFSDSLKDTLDGIFTSILVDHPYLSNNAEHFGQGTELFVNQRRKKTSIKQLFTASSKFQKHLKRGVYLACLLYHEDKVLVTNEEFLPVIEVDENYPRKIQNDFHWFFKIACNWNDLKLLKNDMEKLQNNSAVFRIKLLQAAAHMQTALCIQELGKLYYKMLRDVEGTIVISVINYIHSPKSVSVLNLRWLPFAKLNRKINLVDFPQDNLSDVLISSIPEQITYHQVSKIKLSRGLYLSYLQMNSSIDSLQVLVPFKTPNIPPHCKIRDNPHVTAEEWEWLVKKENLKKSLTCSTYQQKSFIEQIVVTAKSLFTQMGVCDEEAANYRLYDAEVIEVNKDISLIMVVPSAEASYSMLDRREVLLQRPQLLSLTVQAFEIVHLETYQLDLISLYSRLSCIIEMDIDFAQHNLRKAFSDVEVNSAKNKLHELETLQAQLNAAWKKSKWLLDVVSFARDRFSVPHVTMHHLLSVDPKRFLSLAAESNGSSNSEIVKSRSSWHDAGIGHNLNRVLNESSCSDGHKLTPCVVSTISTQDLTMENAEMSLPTKRIDNEEMTAHTHSPSTSITDFKDYSQNKKYHMSQSATNSGSSGSLHSCSSDKLPASSSEVIRNSDSIARDAAPVPVSNPVVIKVYAAFYTGFDTQMYFKFHVSPRTMARDIVDMVIKQINMSVILKGKGRPIYSEKDLSNFCLVWENTAGLRRLRDDLRLAQFPRLCKRGRLYVRLKNDLTSITENDSQTSYV